MTRQLADWRHTWNLLGICVEGETLGHFPDEDLAIVGCRSNDAVVKRVPTQTSTVLSFVAAKGSGARDAPVGVEHGGSVASEQRYLVGELSALVQGNDSECAAAAGLPIDGEVLGVDLQGG